MESNKRLPGERMCNRCVYRGCTNSRIASGKRLFHFPAATDNARFEAWITNCGNTKLRSYAKSTIRRYGICEKHFITSDFTTQAGNRLKRGAVPVKFEESSVQEEDKSNTTISKKKQKVNEDSNIIPMEGAMEANHLSLTRTCEAASLSPARSSGVENSVITQGSSHGDEGKLEERKEQPSGKRDDESKILLKEVHLLRMEIRQLKRKLAKKNTEKIKRRMTDIVKSQRRLRASIKNLVEETNIKPAARALISLQLHQPNVPYLEMEKVVAKQLHYHSPAAMESLRKIGCNFPSGKSIRRWLSEFEIRPGFYEPIIKKLGDKIMQLPQEERWCALKFDETVIKAHEEYSQKLDQIEGLVDLGEFGRYLQRAKCVFFFSLNSINANQLHTFYQNMV